MDTGTLVCKKNPKTNKYIKAGQIYTHVFRGFCRYDLSFPAAVMLPLKLQCLRMKKRQISSLSASLMVLVAPAELAGSVGDVRDVGDVGLLWEGFWESC